jgi:hypothetical protein
MDYHKKYLKYKSKYLKLKIQHGGNAIDNPIRFLLTGLQQNNDAANQITINNNKVNLKNSMTHSNQEMIKSKLNLLTIPKFNELSPVNISISDQKALWNAINELKQYNPAPKYPTAIAPPPPPSR